MTQLIRSNAFLIGRKYGRSQWETLSTWKPAGTWVGAPCVLCLSNGWGFNPGFTAALPDPSDTKPPGTLFDLRWPVVSISVPPTHNNLNHRLVPVEHKLWPGQVRALARAVQYLKVHYDDATLWGAGNSINPDQLVAFGEDGSGTWWLELALTPSGGFYTLGNLPRYTGTFPQQFDHRVRAVIARDCMLDWTQFAMDPTVTGAVLWGDNNHHGFSRRLAGKTWAGQYQSGTPATPSSPANQIPSWVKKAASPWWLLMEGGAALNKVALHTKFGLLPTSGKGASLTFVDWSPGSLKFREDQSKAFYDPAHAYQAEMWDRALRDREFLRKTIWGNDVDNVQGSETTSGFNNVDITDYPEDVSSWLQNAVGLPNLA